MTVKKVKSEKPGSARVEALAPVAGKAANLAETAVDRAQAAFETANELAHGNVQMMDAATSAYKNRFADVQLKAMEFAQLNLNAGFAHMRKLLALRDPAAAMSLQQDFFKAQAETLQQQAKELNDLSVVLARETLQPVQDSLNKSVAAVSRAIAA